LGGPFGSYFYIQGLEFFNKKERQDAKRMKKWKFAVGLGGSFWESFLCTRAGVFQQKRKEGCKKDEQLEGCCRAWGVRLGAISMYKGWSFSTKKKERKQKGRTSATSIKNVAVALVLLVFLKKCCCNQQTGVVPLPFVHSGDMKMAFTHETNGF